ncbi:hypothetical protein [Rurimicrobium arvi]
MKKTRLLALSMIVVSTAVLNSCKKDQVIVNTNGSDMYQSFVPLEIGKYITYDVDSSIWDDVNCIRYSHKSQQQYYVADTFRDDQNRLSYAVNIFSRLTSADNWKVDDVIYYTPAAEKMEVVQKNVRFIKMVNPVKDGQVWQGNSLLPQDDQDFNYLKGWKYTYQNVLQPYDNGARTFDQTVTVSETDQVLNNPETQPDDYGFLLQSKAVYAFRVGMIYREYTYWVYDPVPGSTNCRKGNGVIMRAIDYN